MQTIRRILAAVDFSACSEAAARYAVELAETLGAEVVLFNVYTLPVPFSFPDGSAYIPSAATMAEVSGAAERQLHALNDRIRRAGVTVELASAEGVPRLMIPRAAVEHRCDLIVVGTHGRTGLAHVVLGSVAEAVVRHAPCPVLTVRAPAPAEAHP